MLTHDLRDISPKSWYSEYFHIFISRFAAFGAGETTSLRIYRRDSSINDREIDEQADPYDDETNSATVRKK